MSLWKREGNINKTIVSDHILVICHSQSRTRQGARSLHSRRIWQGGLQPDQLTVIYPFQVRVLHSPTPAVFLLMILQWPNSHIKEIDKIVTQHKGQDLQRVQKHWKTLYHMIQHRWLWSLLYPQRQYRKFLKISIVIFSNLKIKKILTIGSLTRNKQSIVNTNILLCQDNWWLVFTPDCKYMAKADLFWISMLLSSRLFYGSVMYCNLKKEKTESDPLNQGLSLLKLAKNK